MDKKEYERLQLDIVWLSADDIVTTSGEPNGDVEGENDYFPGWANDYFVRGME